MKNYSNETYIRHFAQAGQKISQYISTRFQLILLQ